MPYSVHPSTKRRYLFEDDWGIDDAALAALGEQIVELFGGARSQRDRAHACDERTEAAGRAAVDAFRRAQREAQGRDRRLARGPGERGAGVSGTVGALDNPTRSTASARTGSRSRRITAIRSASCTHSQDFPASTCSCRHEIKVAESHELGHSDAARSAARPSPVPLDTLPDWVARYVEQLSQEMQTPIDLAGVLALGVLSAAAGGRVRVCPATAGSSR